MSSSFKRKQKNNKQKTTVLSFVNNINKEKNISSWWKKFLCKSKLEELSSTNIRLPSMMMWNMALISGH